MIKFNGIIQVTGESGAGKTTFGLDVGVPPEQIAFIDNDVKGEQDKRDIESTNHKLGFYVNLLQETEKMKEIETHVYCLGIIREKIAKLKPAVILWDTWTPFENTMYPWVLSHQKEFRDSYSAMGVIKTGEIWQESFKYESAIMSELLSYSKIVVLTCHLKQDRTTKTMIPNQKRPLIQSTHLRLWLRHNPNGGALPIGLVLKRIAKRIILENGNVSTVALLPRRIDPCTWEKINWYYDNPIGNSKPDKSETPDDYEISVLDGILTEDQKIAMRIAAKEESSDDEASFDVKSIVEMKKKQGMSLPAIATELGMKLQDVISALNKE
jgi:hypothetical protein